MGKWIHEKSKEIPKIMDDNQAISLKATSPEYSNIMNDSRENYFHGRNKTDRLSDCLNILRELYISVGEFVVT